MKLIPKILTRLYNDHESDITINEMREIHQDLINYNSMELFDKVAELIVYNFDEEEKKTDEAISGEGVVDAALEHMGVKRADNEHIDYFKNEGFIFNDDTYPSAFGKSHYIYRSKGSRVLWFDDGNVVFSSLYTYLDSKRFQFSYDEIDHINIYDNCFDNDMVFTDYWLETESAEFNKIAFFIIKNLMNINMNYNRDYPLEHLFISEDVRKLSEYSRRVRKDVMDHVINLCKSTISGDDEAYNELKYYHDFLDLVEIDVPSYELVNLIKYVSNHKSNINQEKLDIVINMLNQNSKNNNSYYSTDYDLIINELEKIPTGKDDAYRYQSVVEESLEAIFKDQLFRKQSERKINDGRKRIDIMFSNEAKHGFFHRLKNDYNLFCPNIVVECKNYCNDPSNPEIDQLIARLNNRISCFGILVIREVSDTLKLRYRLKDALCDNKHIIYLSDADLLTLLDYKKKGLEREISDYMNVKYEEIAL